MSGPSPVTTNPASPDGAPQADEKAAPPLSLRGAAWPLLLSLVVLGVIAYFTFEPASFRQMARSVNGWLLAAAAATSGLQIVFGGLRWWHIARQRVGLAAGMRTQLAWQFFSNVTPSTVGGGPPAAFYLARDQDLPLGETTAFMLLAVLLDQLWTVAAIPLVLLAMLFLDVIPASVGSVGAWTFVAYFAGMLVWASLFAFALLFRPHLLQRLAGWLFRLRWLRRFRPRVMREMNRFTRRAQAFRQQPARFYVGGFFYTAALWMTRYLLVLLIIWSVFPGADGLLIVVRTAALMLCSLVLPTPGGAGGLEGLYALFLAPLMPEALVAPTLLTFRILGYYVFIALGVSLSFHHVRQHLRKRQETPTPAAPESAAPAQEIEHGE